MQLFMIYIGGAHPNSFIELHDIRFVIADSIEATYDELRKSWWGSADSLHLDCWGILKHIDGYDIHLKKFPAEGEKKLYFVNMGGYDSVQFTELHKNFCVVASNTIEAKQKAYRQLAHWQSPHKDYLHEVESVVSIQDVLNKKGLYIHLQPNQHATPFVFTCQYVPISAER